MPDLRLLILSDSEVVLDCRADQVVFATPYGSIGILGGHHPLLAKLERQVIRYQTDNQWKEMADVMGFVRVEPDQVTILLDDYGHQL